MNQLSVRRGGERGLANLGWLRSLHSFSFGDYYDPHFMGFSALRVINEDRVLPGQGFSTHGHANMEIISLVLDGQLAHKDSAGNQEILTTGEVQLMSAGSGIRHSEFNPSRDRGVHFLQIWVEPNVVDQEPGYQQKRFAQENGMTLIASPNAEQGSLLIKQDCRVYQVFIAAGETLQPPVVSHRRYYLHLIAGELSVNGERLIAGDAISLCASEAIDLQAQGCRAHGLWFDLP